MRIFSSFVFSFFVLAFYSCNLKSGHPQSDLAQDSVATNINEKLIQAYADSVDSNRPAAEKQASLVYVKGDETFYAEQYVLREKPILLTSYEDNGSLTTLNKKYYFKNDSLVLVKSSIHKASQTSSAFRDTLVYLRNNTVFKISYRESTDPAQLKTTRYKNLSSGKNIDYANYNRQVQVIDDALHQLSQFEMVFDKVNDLPDESYIVLKSKVPNGYQASVLIENKDDYIDSLSAEPIKFKGEKISFQWLVEDNQAIYIPAPAKTTSASGLNK